MNQEQAEKILEPFLSEENKIYKLDDGTLDEGLSINKATAFMILHGLFENDNKILNIIKSLIPLGNPMVKVDLFLEQSKENEKNLLELHKTIVSGFHKKIDSFYGNLPDDR